MHHPKLLVHASLSMHIRRHVGCVHIPFFADKPTSFMLNLPIKKTFLKLNRQTALNISDRNICYY